MTIPRFLLCIAMALVPVVARAQEPRHSLEELRTTRSLGAGSYVRVAVRGGWALRGRVESISDEVLRLRVNGESREVPEASVERIWRRRPEDPAWNGALIGMGAGLGAGIAMARGHCTLPDDECLAITTLLFVPAFAGGGALIGYFIDRAIFGYDVVFDAASGSPRTTVSPVFSGNGVGLEVALSF